MDKETLIIIGGGPSVKNIPVRDLHKYGYVIGVNESSVLVPCHAAISMDRLWMEARYEELMVKNIPVYFRKCAWKIGHMWSNLTLFDGDVHAQGMSPKRGTLHGKNSGACALNLAYHIGPKRVFLFGFDMKTDEEGGHYHFDESPLRKIKEKITGKPFPEKKGGSKYKYWIPQFSIVREQMDGANIKVYNVNPDSAINDFEKINYEEFLCLVK